MRRMEFPTKDLKLKKIWFMFGWIMIFGICYFSLTPQIPNINPDWPNGDKLHHFLSYLIVTFWFMLISLPSSNTLILSAFFALGLIMEILQFFLPYRSFDFLDILANGGGCFLAFLLGNTRLAFSLLALEKNFGKSQT